MNDEKSILPEELNRGLRKSCERFCAEIQMKWTEEFQRDFTAFISHFDFEAIEVLTDDAGKPILHSKLVTNSNEPGAE